MLPGALRQAQFWAELGRALVAEKKTRDEGIGMLLRADRLAPRMPGRPRRLPGHVPRWLGDRCPRLGVQG